jgi:sugar/nucleoside kinase (ribokinase family)
MFDLLVLGDANPDVIVGPLTEPLAFGQHEQLVDAGVLTPGGSAAIMACGAARLGLSVAFAGRVGDDDAGRFMRNAFASRGVNTDALHTDPDLPTPLTVIVTRGGDRAMLTASGALTATTGADVPAAVLTSCRHVHVSSYFLMPALANELPGLLSLARRHGATTSLDTNDDPAGKWDVGTVLDEVDILLPNAQEAMRLSGAGSLTAAAEILAARGPLVAVKDGAAGAICQKGNILLRTNGIRVSPVDTVGAGDSFDAGFVAAKLRGMTDQQALDVAAACGGLSTMAAGGTTSQPTWDDLEEQA